MDIVDSISGLFSFKIMAVTATVLTGYHAYTTVVSPRNKSPSKDQAFTNTTSTKTTPHGNDTTSIPLHYEWKPISSKHKIVVPRVSAVSAEKALHTEEDDSGAPTDDMGTRSTSESTALYELVSDVIQEYLVHKEGAEYLMEHECFDKDDSFTSQYYLDANTDRLVCREHENVHKDGLLKMKFPIPKPRRSICVSGTQVPWQSQYHREFIADKPVYTSHGFTWFHDEILDKIKPWNGKLLWMDLLRLCTLFADLVDVEISLPNSFSTKTTPNVSTVQTAGVSKDEFMTLLPTSIGNVNDNRLSEFLFAVYDRDKDGVISFVDFCVGISFIQECPLNQKVNLLPTIYPRLFKQEFSRLALEDMLGNYIDLMKLSFKQAVTLQKFNADDFFKHYYSDPQEFLTKSEFTVGEPPSPNYTQPTLPCELPNNVQEHLKHGIWQQSLQVDPLALLSLTDFENDDLKHVPTDPTNRLTVLDISQMWDISARTVVDKLYDGMQDFPEDRFSKEIKRRFAASEEFKGIINTILEAGIV